MNETWSIISAISTTIQTVAVIITLIYAANQLRSMSKDRHLELLFKLHEMFSEPKARAARYYIFSNFPLDTLELSEEEYKAARDTWNIMDQVGIVAHHNLASRELLLELFSLQTVRLWKKLEPHIHYYRGIRGDFAVYFEELAKLSREYRKRKYNEDEPIFFKRKIDKSSQGEILSHVRITENSQPATPQPNKSLNPTAR